MIQINGNLLYLCDSYIESVCWVMNDIQQVLESGIKCCKNLDEWMNELRNIITRLSRT